MTEQANRRAGRSELGMALLLGAVGAVVLWNALSIQPTSSQVDPVGPRGVPFIVAGLLLVCAVWLAVDVLRGGHGESEAGEDIDLSQPSDWRVVLPLGVVFLANVLLVDRLGWVISGTLLFWGSAWALGSRHYVRDPLIALGLSLGTFYGFYSGLGILLPAGVLAGVL